MENNKEFAPKGADVLRQEVIDVSGLDPENEVNKEVIDNIVTKLRLKDQELIASLHKQKTNAKKEAENFKKAKEFYKKGGPKGDDKNQDKNKDQDIDTLVSEKVYLKQGGTHTEVRMIKQVMKNFGIDFDKAQNHKIFLTWKKMNDEDIKDKNAQLGPSRGGKPVDKAVNMTEKDKEFLQAMGVKEKK